MKFDMVVAIAGQPNVGKSTLLNRILGEAISHVGNWPGKTVELIYGIKSYNGFSILFVDLPGTYDLIGTSEEEEIAIKYLLGLMGKKHHKHRRSICERCPLRSFCPLGDFCLIRKIFEREEFDLYSPDIVVVLLDATQLEKGLSFAIAIREIFSRVIVAINKIDELKGSINIKKLSKELKAPVVEISALNGLGIDDLLETIIKTWKSLKKEEFKVNYGILEEEIKKIEKSLGNVKNKRIWAIKILENSPIAHELFGEKAKEFYDSVKNRLKVHPEEIIKKTRMDLAKEIMNKVVVEKERISLTKVDLLFLNKYFGPIFSFLILLSTLVLTFSVNTGFPLNLVMEKLGYKDLARIIERYNLMSLLNNLTGKFIDCLKNILPQSILVRFFVEGILGGFLFILTFLPVIFSVLFFLTLLEDSGLFARISISIHYLLKKFGLSGKTIFPLMFSFGCNTPAISSTRILRKNEKIAIALASPFVICQARLVVLTAISSVAFRNVILNIVVILSIYFLSILLYFAIGSIIKKSLGEKGSEIIMEIPRLRRPSVRVAFWNAWLLTKHFLEKAGKIIVTLSAFVWFLINFGPSGYAGIENSYAYLLGKFLSPIAKLWGIKDSNSAWKIMFAFFQGIIAKEGLVVTIAQFSGGEFESAWTSLGLTTIQSYAILLAMMFYVPCLATIVAIKSELNSWKWAIISIILMIAISVTISAGFYWTARALGFE